MAPGTLCAFGGAQVASSAGCPPFTHAVRFRFGSQAAANQFLTSEAVQGVLADDSTSTSQRNTTVLFEGRIASDLEAMFCRGSEWERGAEHAIIFKAASTATSEQIEEYLVQLAALAESSLAGALQCTYGKIQWSKGNIAGPPSKS
ncbi:hypothetical protein WJX75_009165 [Coccomyxa subellipsoidea]|uniref:Uncharacterized protein n=1 Tax=Coccomyxa subellipsoidea TaxID=248742 RepID=A0ABR2YLK3_9CHLO